MSVTRELTIVNEKGLHARASAKLVELVETFDAEAEISKDGLSATGDSIMGLLMLAASRGTSISVETTGTQDAELMEAIDALVAQVLPTHAELWNSGQIEVTTSPLAHPILPLIADTDLASIGDPTAILPREPFREPADAEAQVQRGLERANELLGQTPNGMWPGEGAVAQAVMPIFAQNDVAWVASGEDVLAQSLGNGGFSRDVNDTVIDAVDLYKPYTVSTASGEVDMFFRDVRLSDLIGFEYSNLDADLAAADLMNRLDEIRSQLARSGLTATSGETPVVTLVIDGENAWENYPNDGRDFLRAMYGAFTSTPWLKTTTPSAYLTDHPTATDSLEEVYPAAWFSPNFATWIGEPEEARAWELLRLARIDLADADRRGSASSEQLAAATNLMYQAQGSDWFWWYGDDQDSGNDRYFDNAFRELLGQMYDALGQARPRWTSVPIIPDPRVVPISSTGEPITVRIDGNPADFLDAANFDFAIDGDVITTLAVAVDENRVGMLFEGGYDDGMDIYIGAPGGVRQRGTTIDDRFVLGFDATHLIRWNEREGACISSVLAPETVINSYPQTCERLESALSASGVELAIPNEILGQLTAGDRLNIRIQTGSSLSPSSGPAESPIPDIANFDEIRQFSDAGGDDHGPGSYTYPTDRVFVPGSFDLREVVVGESGPTPEDDVVFSFLLDTPIDNPFNSPIGLSLQSIDLYLDYDPGAGTGRQALLNGRNASLAVGNGWEAAIAIEGWESAIAVPRGASYTEVDSGFAVSVLAEQGLVTLRIPRRSLPVGLDLRTAGVGVAVMAQEGFPSPGVRRIRNVAPTASQWEFGGGNSGGGDTRIIDALTPGDQGSLLAENVLPLNLP